MEGGESHIQSQERYKDFESRHNRHLNMLTDNDRNLRRQALTEFTKAMNSDKDDEIVQFFYRERLAKRLVIALEDQIEKNRELSIALLVSMTERLGFKEESAILIPVVTARMNQTPYIEGSEEVRLQLLNLLSICLDKDKFQFLPQIGEVCQMISKLAMDANPDMKLEIAKFAGKLCRSLQEKVGHFMKQSVISFVKNLQHQHSKVRKETLRGLKDILVCRGAEPFFLETVQQLKFSMNDRSQDVRQTFYQVVEHWITNMEINALKEHDHIFLLFLLNGVSDDNKEISSKCIQMMESHGLQMKEALVALGEEEEEEKSATIEKEEKAGDMMQTD